MSQDTEIESTELDDDTLLDDDDMDSTLLNGMEALAEEELEEDPAEEDPAEEDKDEEPPEPEHEEKRNKPLHTNMVPQARFNEERSKSKIKDQTIAELSRELEEAKAKLADMPVFGKDAEQPAELKELYKKYKEALFEDDDSALDIQKEIDAFNRSYAEQMLDRKLQERDIAQQSKTLQQLVASEEGLMDQTIVDWQASVPELNPESDVFDLDLWNDTMMYQAALVEKGGMRGNDALVKAFNKFAGQLMPEDNKPAKPDAKPVDKRTAQSVNRGVTQSRQSAPNIINVESVGNRANTKQAIDFSKLSEEEFNKLPRSVIDAAKGKKH